MNNIYFNKSNVLSAGIASCITFASVLCLECAASLLNNKIQEKKKYHMIEEDELTEENEKENELFEGVETIQV